MNILGILLKIVIGVVPLIFGAIPAADPERRKRRDAEQAVKMWWAFRRRLYLVEQRGAGDGRVLNIRDDLARWTESCERQGEDIAAMETAFQATIAEAAAARQRK